MKAGRICTPVKAKESYRFQCPVPDILRVKRDPLFDLVKDPKVIVEIGSQWGWFAYRACVHTNARVYCIDPWGLESRGDSDDLFEWSHNLEVFIGNRVVGLHGTSSSWVTEFEDESVDLILVDGNHESEFVALDCKLWWPKVRRGGVMVGDDYCGRWKPKVKAGVEKAFGKKYRTKKLFLRSYPRRIEAKQTRLANCWYKRKR